MKVVVNRCFGGFSVSQRAAELMQCDHEKKPWDTYGYGHDEHHNRMCPELVRVVELLGDAANGRNAELEVVDVPDDVKWHIHEYDGSEEIAEDHRTW